MGAVVEAGVPAQLQDAVDLTLGACGEIDHGTGVASHLDGRRPDAAAAGVNEYRFPCPELGQPEQRFVGGAEDLDHRGALDKSPGLGKGRRQPLVHDGVLGVGALGDQAEDPVAHRVVVGPVAEGRNLPGQLEAGDVADPGRHGVEPLALQAVGAIDPDRPHSHQNLLGPRLRFRCLGDGQDLGAAIARQRDHLHRALLLLPTPTSELPSRVQMAILTLEPTAIRRMSVTSPRNANLTAPSFALERTEAESNHDQQEAPRMKRILFTLAVLGIAVSVSTLAAPLRAETVLRIDEVAVGELDPMKAQDVADSILFYNAYDTLVFPALDGSGSGLQPLLAEKIDIDGTTYTITLREGVKFHSGNVLDADDVVFSLNRMIALGQGFSYLFKGWVENVVAKDQRTVVVTLAKPYAPFHTALLRLPIMDKDDVLAHKEPGDFGEFGDYGQAYAHTHAAGTGAYRVEFPRPAAVDGAAEVRGLLPGSCRQGAGRRAPALRAQGSDHPDLHEPRGA